MTQKNKTTLGIILLVVGILVLLSRLDLLPFTLWFHGWWTLIIIIPAIISMKRQGITAGNVILLFVGVYLFLKENEWDLSGYLLPAILVIVGGYLLLRK